MASYLSHKIAQPMESCENISAMEMKPQEMKVMMLQKRETQGGKENSKCYTESSKAKKELILAAALFQP